MPKRKKEKIFEENEQNKIRMLSDLENIKESKLKAKYCIEKINIRWMKEFGRIDPEGASLFLDPRIPIFWRIFLPFVILLNFVNFITASFFWCLMSVEKYELLPCLTLVFLILCKMHGKLEPGLWQF